MVSVKDNESVACDLGMVLFWEVSKYRNKNGHAKRIR